MTDIVEHMRFLFNKMDQNEHKIAYEIFGKSIAEIDRLRRDKERALAALRFAASAKYDEEAVRYAAEVAIEEITI